jgi:glycosyltransferase involved in cell wall biosynthesis
LTIRILAIGDTANNIAVLRKFVKRSTIHLINFPRRGPAVYTYAEDVEFFDSLKISEQVRKINQIKNNYDICLVNSWPGARVAYLAGINYIMYFVGGDIVTPPFVKNPKVGYLEESIHKMNTIERLFYKKVFDTAIACVTITEEYFNHLKKYRIDGIRMDRIPVDITIYNENVKPIEREKSKFIFFSPQRFGLEKGGDIIWEALRLCKSDFEVLQVEWFDERTSQEQEIKRRFIETKPPQVTFIPLIKRGDMPRYYRFADAVLGQMRAGIQGGIEREAVWCKTPVIHYSDPQRKIMLDGKEINPPYLPHSRDPRELANLIDKIVQSKEFRDKLLEEEYRFVKEQSDPEKAIPEWENLFEDMVKRYKSIHRKDSSLKLKFVSYLVYFVESFVYGKKLKRKWVQQYGESEFHKLYK